MRLAKSFLVMGSLFALLFLPVWACPGQQTAPTAPSPPATAESQPATTRPADGDTQQAMKTYALGDYAGVIGLLELRYRNGQLNIQQRLILARAWLHQQQAEQAIAVLKSVLATDRENGEANFMLGKALHASGQDKEALEYLKAARRLKQDSASASLLGSCYYALGDPVKAKASLEAAMKEDVRDPANSFLLGRICLDRGMGALAEKYLLTAQEAGLEGTQLHLLLGQAYLMQRKYVGPILVQRINGAAKPGDIVGGQVILGSLEGAPGQYKACTRYCALYEGCQVLAAEPANADGLYMLAAGWLSVGEKDQARKYLQMLERSEPASQRVRELQVQLLLREKDYAALDKALAATRGIAGFDGERIAGLYHQAAMMLRADGDRDRAVEMLRKAEALAPTSQQILRSLASLYASMDKKDQAGRYYGRLVELYPDAEDIGELTSQLRVLQGNTGGKP